MTSDPEVPEADALEQSMPVTDDADAGEDAGSTFADDTSAPPLSELAADVPEADALEQARPAGADDRDEDGYAGYDGRA